MMSLDLPFSMDALYDGLLDHISSESKDAAFELDSLPSEEAYQAQARAQASLNEPANKKKQGAAAGPTPASTPAETAKQAAEAKAVTNEALNKVVEELGADCGPLQHSCKPAYLTEAEAEYTVQVIKHMFKQHIVLEMSVANTVQGVTLENIEVKLTGIEPKFAKLGDTSIVKLEYSQQASAYIVLAKKSQEFSASFACSLKYIVKEDGDDVGYEDDCPVDNATLALGDFMCPRGLPQGQHKSVWEQLGSSGTECQKDMSLNFKSIEAANDAIIATLNMQPNENTGKVEAGVKGHTLLMSGTFLGGNTAVVKAMLRMHEEKGLMARIACRSRSQAVCDLVASAML